MTKLTKDEAGKIASERLVREKRTDLANTANHLVGYIGYIVSNIRSKTYSDSNDFYHDTEGLYNLTETLHTICHIACLDAEELISQYSDEFDYLRTGMMEDTSGTNNN